ncbi:LLM class flavin-dependent oxidoreductase [Pseudochelatococcus lubricantis]|uniref:LLM class flavin-dependent oxidoreductase n=1 Tax=Pseudochelatococcus lubricantis TaxID=1538102 RepID=UPI0035E51863
MPTASKRELHLGLNVLAAGMHPAAWQFPGTDPLGYIKPSQWRHIAAVAEKGTLDAIFLADGTNVPLGPDGQVAGPVNSFDPVVLLSVLAGQTSHVGLVATVSTTVDNPFGLARRIASLDHLSGGRAAWNVVTTWDAATTDNFGGEPHADREQRYAKAVEFVDVVRALWDSWDDDALVADLTAAQFTRPHSVRPVNHRGRFFSVKGPLNLPRAPQGQPVLFQAGGSPGGLDLAARHADAVFASLGSLDHALEFTRDLRRRTAAYGRPADAIRVMPGLSFILGGTEAEARERARVLNDLAGDRRLATFARQLGVDAGELAWDKPLPRSLLETTELSPHSQGAREIALRLARRETLTVRELLDRVQSWHRLVIGSPEQLADAIEEWFAAGAVDGFNLMPDVEPSGLEDFVEHVVPILRNRGIFRREYAGSTLRDHLGLQRPSSRFAESRAAG